MSKVVYVREGNTGILFLKDEGGRESRFIPNYDMDDAQSMLMRFQGIKDECDIALKDNYHVKGNNWYPSMVSFLFWSVFFPYVKYRDLVDDFLAGTKEFRFTNTGTFSRLMGLFQPSGILSQCKIRIFFFLIWLNNAYVVRRHKTALLFFRFAKNDFRSVEIRKVLDQHGAAYTEVLPPGRIIDVLRNILNGTPRYFFGSYTTRNVFRKKYDLGSLRPGKRRLVQRAIEITEATITGYLGEYSRHERTLAGRGFKTFYGFDDANGYIFPILYACNDLGIRTIAHQHGAYVRRHAAYAMEGINRSEYRWFGKVIVWGEYWKQQLLKISDAYSPDQIVVGSNKLSWNYEPQGDRPDGTRSVLIPYEFLTNTFKVGLYIRRFIDLGYKVYFKVRSDESINDQIEAYCLPEEVRSKLIIVEKLDNALLKEIAIVAGTMTTLIYELLPYGKIVWILETEYRHLEDLVEEGYAHKVRYEDLDRLDASYFTKPNIEREFLFSRISLEQTLKEHVLAQSN